VPLSDGAPTPAQECLHEQRLSLYNICNGQAERMVTFTTAGALVTEEEGGA